MAQPPTPCPTLPHACTQPPPARASVLHGRPRPRARRSRGAHMRARAARGAAASGGRAVPHLCVEHDVLHHLAGQPLDLLGRQVGGVAADLGQGGLDGEGGGKG